MSPHEALSFTTEVIGKPVVKKTSKESFTDMQVSNPTTRYFLMKSYSHDNIGRSFQHNVWATSQRNEKVLQAAYETSAFVVLIFSVNHSSRFSGFAVMTSLPGHSSCDGRAVFCGPDGTPFPGRMFSIHWVARSELFFRDCEQLVNTYNEKKSVKVGRDGQEVDAIAGAKLCWLMDSTPRPENSSGRPSHMTCGLKSGLTHSSRFSHDSKPSLHITNTTKNNPLGWKRLSHTRDACDVSTSNQTRNVGGLLRHPSKQEESAESLPEGFSVVYDSRKPFGEQDHQSHAPSYHVAPPSVSFDWVEKEISANPILSIFPLNLTEILTYEEYQNIYRESKLFWKNLEETYGPENVPSLPKSVSLSQEELEAFDATILLNLLDRSASQDEVDTFLKPLFPAHQ